MNTERRSIARAITLAAFLLLVRVGLPAQHLSYPPADKGTQTDNYFGVSVADPYRWLEDDTSAATAAWVEAENKVTSAYLEKIPYRGKLKDRLDALYNYPKYSAPFRKGDYFYFYKNSGLQNQSVLYIQKGLDGATETLLDPNTFSADGTTRLSGFTLSRDGSSAAYAISRAGSDWQEYCIMDMTTRKISSDTLKWIKVSNISWAGNGFYYSRYDAPETGKELSSQNVYHKVYYHALHTAQSKDRLVYEDPAHAQRFHITQTTEDEKYLILTISERGKGTKGNSILYKRTDEPDAPFIPIVSEIGDFSYNLIDNVGESFLLRTDENAPNGKVMLCDLKHAAKGDWKVVIPEQHEPLQSASTVIRRPSARTKPETSMALALAWAERRSVPATLRQL